MATCPNSAGMLTKTLIIHAKQQLSPRWFQFPFLPGAGRRHGSRDRGTSRGKDAHSVFAAWTQDSCVALVNTPSLLQLRPATPAEKPHPVTPALQALGARQETSVSPHQGKGSGRGDGQQRERRPLSLGKSGVATHGSRAQTGLPVTPGGPWSTRCLQRKSGDGPQCRWQRPRLRIPPQILTERQGGPGRRWENTEPRSHPHPTPWSLRPCDLTPQKGLGRCGSGRDLET